MVRKNILTAAITLVVILLCLMVYMIIRRVSEKKLLAERVQYFPVSSLLKLDSTRYQRNFLGPALLVYYNSECEHCQSELDLFRKNIASFEKVTIVFMSSENIDDIKETSLKYDLNSSPTIEFVKINKEDVFTTFGALSVPHLFLYGGDGKLIKEFKGETSVQAILHYLP